MAQRLRVLLRRERPNYPWELRHFPRRGNTTSAVSTRATFRGILNEEAMMRERLIWRPNAVAPDVWEAMSREDQIAWWRTQTKAPPQPKRHMKEAITLYNKGGITIGEFVCLVYELAAPDEIEEFVSACPAELLSALKESLASYGEEESAWPRTFYIASYAPWVTPEEIEEERRKEQQRIWDGVRLLKKWGQVLTNG